MVTSYTGEHASCAVYLHAVSMLTERDWWPGIPSKGRATTREGAAMRLRTCLKAASLCGAAGPEGAKLLETNTTWRDRLGILIAVRHDTLSEKARQSGAQGPLCASKTTTTPWCCLLATVWLCLAVFDLADRSERGRCCAVQALPALRCR